MAKLTSEQIESQLWPNGGTRDVWMILDGARDRRIYSDLTNSYFESSCLYSGDLPYELEAAAPHLVRLEYEDKETRRLLSRSIGNSWGVFLKADTSLTRLRSHLRTLLIVRDWKGSKLYFRYYDPRVLRAYLPTCTTEELKSVFGPIKQFWTEDRDGSELLPFALQNGRLLKRVVEEVVGDPS